MTIEISPE
jgi:hypothetical protein